MSRLIYRLTLWLMLVPTISHATTYNFYFNNTEQGDNSTATPSLSVVEDGKGPPQVIKNGEVQAPASAESTAVEEAAPPPQEPVPVSEYRFRRWALTGEIISVFNKPSDSSRKQYQGVQLGIDYSLYPAFTVGAFLGLVGAGQHQTEDPPDNVRTGTYTSRKVNNNDSGEFRLTYGAGVSFYPLRYEFSKNYDVIVGGFTLGVMNAWYSDARRENISMRAHKRDVSVIYGFVGLRGAIYLDQRWGISLASNHAASSARDTSVSTVSIGGVYRL